MPSVPRPRLARSATVVVAKYRRVSTRDQLDGFGLEDQDKTCDDWLSSHPDAILYGEYTDEGVSGALESRPEMDRLVREARKQSFNRVLVSSVDRIGRTARAAYQLAWNMADVGIYFISVSEGIDTSTQSGWQRFMQYVSLSEREWRRIKERTSAGRELKITYGGWPGGPAPYGYRIENEISNVAGRRKRFSVLVTDEYEAKVLCVAVELIVDEGMNLTEASAELNKRKLYTRSGVPWSVGNLRNRLHSETIHCGYTTYRKTGRGSGKNTTRRCDDGTPVHGEPVRIGVPPIFSTERGEQLMAALQKIGFRNGRRDNRLYLLSGRIQGVCGEVYTGVSRGGGRTGRTYRCKGVLTEPSCREPYLAADDIEGVVWEELIRLLEGEGGTRVRETAVERFSSRSGDRATYEDRVTDFQRRINEQEHVIQVRVPEYVRAGVDAAVLKASVTALEEELAGYRQQQQFAEQWLEQYAAHERRARNLLGIANHAEEQLENLTIEERKEILDMFDLQIVPDYLSETRKPGVRCEVSEWHWKTGTHVPPDPTDEEWEAVLAVVRPYFSKKHFTSKYDIRQQFNGMLHRLRNGLSWGNMPLAWGPTERIRERQLQWWQKGAWPGVMSVLRANEMEVEAYERPTLPPLTVTCRLRPA